MGTKNVSTQTSAFAPSGMGAYNSLMPQMQGVLQSFMQNPMQAGYMNMLLQQGLRGASQQGVGQQQNLMQSLAAGGFGGQNLQPFLQSQMGKIGRSVSGMKAQDYMNTLLQSANLKMQAANTASGFRPLQTGSTQTQQTSGLGTWLPTVLGAGLNFATGGMSGLLGGAMGSIFPSTMGNLSSGPGFGSMPSLNLGVGQMPQVPNGLLGPMGGAVPAGPAYT